MYAAVIPLCENENIETTLIQMHCVYEQTALDQDIHNGYLGPRLGSVRKSQE